MLVISRNDGEAIEIGSDILIVVLGFRAGKVRIGIQAPKEIVVDRGEVAEAKRRNARRETKGKSRG